MTRRGRVADAATAAARAAFDLACAQEGPVLDDPSGAEDRPWRAAIGAVFRSIADEMDRPGIAHLIEAWPTVFGDDPVFAEQVVRELFGTLRERADSAVPS